MANSPAEVMDATRVANELLADTKQRAERFTRASGRQPMLAAGLVGNDLASTTYLRMKQSRSAQVGIESSLVKLGADITTEEAVRAVRALSDASDVDGVLVQPPVPAHVDERPVFEAIAPEKDLDGVTMKLYAAMAFGLPGFTSCTPGGIIRLLDA
jgi:methylenetetrahydrofolate dehydrogenase (NADP+)/methenyltetrahydrofolate cyclohydrolase